MYELKALLPKFDIQVPSCMYSLRNVSLALDISGPESNSTVNGFEHASGVDTTVVRKTHTAISAALSASSKNLCALDLDILDAKIQQLLQSSNDVEKIVLRQDKVLEQLKQLKAQLEGIRSTLGVCQTNNHQMATNDIPHNDRKKEPLPDIVINGHPNFIPYALLALKNTWKDVFGLNIKTFTHSTMTDIGPEARAFEKKLTEVAVDPRKPSLNVTLIWKNCEHTEMISSPTMYVPIYGEVNFIRYFGRLGPASYRYEDSPLCNEIDAVLDICYQLLRSTTPKRKASLIRSLSNRVQNQKYFGGKEMSIADIGVHSSLKRMSSITDKDLTPVLLEWRQRVQTVTMI